MRWATLGERVVVRAPAKVNLFLEVLGKRPDGYHEIATLLLAVRRHDTLCFAEAPSGQLQLQCDRADLATGPDNLILKAARLLQAKTGCERGAAIFLKKRIPWAAGLAGGSSDAAATLVGLNQLWRLRIEPPRLQEWSAELGSDIPFFFATPAAWCTGRGEKVETVKLGLPLDLVIVSPPVGLATPLVYKNVIVPEQPQSGDAIRRALAQGDIEALGKSLHNRLQESAERLCPRVKEEFERISALGPAGTLMSGSGSSLFALCRDRQEAERIANQLRHDGEGSGSEASSRVDVVRSCSEQPG